MMLSRIIANSGEWLTGKGPHRQIVVSSRIRLARNIHLKPFPGWAKKDERLEILDEVKKAVEELPEMQEAFSENLDSLTSLEKQILVERHLISREHAAKGAGSAVVMNMEQTLSFMINEEDHLRMQAILSGLQLREVYELINKTDNELDDALDFAFHEKLGFLTACPTNVGTGMRCSAMLHLPALVMSEHIKSVINSINKIGLVVRGLHGEGSEAMGNLFQISNQATLGESEEEIVNRLDNVIRKIVELEGNSRSVLAEKNSDRLLDQVGRAYGILSYACTMTSKEALDLLSVIKLGADLGLFPDSSAQAVDELLIEIQPAHLQKGASTQKMQAHERDSLRAELIRARLASMPAPDKAKFFEKTSFTNSQS
ncbi:MAG: protein arginine kinase [Chthoniobacterales bacterium]